MRTQPNAPLPLPSSGKRMPSAIEHESRRLGISYSLNGLLEQLSYHIKCSTSHQICNEEREDMWKDNCVHEVSSLVSDY